MNSTRRCQLRKPVSAAAAAYVVTLLVATSCIGRAEAQAEAQILVRVFGMDYDEIDCVWPPPLVQPFTVPPPPDASAGIADESLMAALQSAEARNRVALDLRDVVGPLPCARYIGDSNADDADGSDTILVSRPGFAPGGERAVVFIRAQGTDALELLVNTAGRWEYVSRWEASDPRR